MKNRTTQLHSPTLCQHSKCDLFNKLTWLSYRALNSEASEVHCIKSTRSYVFWLAGCKCWGYNTSAGTKSMNTLKESVASIIWFQFPIVLKLNLFWCNMIWSNMIFFFNRTKNQTERMLLLKKNKRKFYVSEQRCSYITRIRDVLVVNYQPIIALDW